MNENRGCSSVGVALFGVVISVLYLANLTMGIVEIPDNLPLFGNLDEVFFSGVLFASLAKLGIRLPFMDSTRTGARTSDAQRGSAARGDDFDQKDLPRNPPR